MNINIINKALCLIKKLHQPSGLGIDTQKSKEIIDIR